MPKFDARLIALLRSALAAFRRASLAQGETTSAIVGTVADPSGAAVAGATVTIVSTDTGSKRTRKNRRRRPFQFPAVEARDPTPSRPRRRDSSRRPTRRLSAGLGQRQTVNFILKLAAVKGAVTVTGEAPLVNPDNPNTATTLNAPALENLPESRRRHDLPIAVRARRPDEYRRQRQRLRRRHERLRQRAVQRLPALANGYIVDGLETNDPLTNLNSGLSTNLVLGLNSIAEVTVNTLSYTVDQGRYGASQVNYVTKSGHEPVSRKPLRAVERIADSMPPTFSPTPLRETTSRAQP